VDDLITPPDPSNRPNGDEEDLHGFEGCRGIDRQSTQRRYLENGVASSSMMYEEDEDEENFEEGSN
jgi:hypothetical protein